MELESKLQILKQLNIINGQIFDENWCVNFDNWWEVPLSRMLKKFNALQFRALVAFFFWGPLGRDQLSTTRAPPPEFNRGGYNPAYPQGGAPGQGGYDPTYTGQRPPTGTGIPNKDARSLNVIIFTLLTSLP